MADLALVRPPHPHPHPVPSARFLRARKFDVVKAKEMLLACEQWRIDFKVDELMKCVFFPSRFFCLLSAASAWWPRGGRAGALWRVLTARA